MARAEKDKMLAGEPYRPADPALRQARAENQARLALYNARGMDEEDEQRARLLAIVGAAGPGTVVRPGFQCCYGRNIRLGRDVFLNFGCVILDVCAVSVGDGTQVGPTVQIYAADHPRDPDRRRAGIEWGRPVTIGCNVWIGGGAIILPGVTIGDDAIVGAGSVVTRDVAAGATAVGNPARPQRSGREPP